LANPQRVVKPKKSGYATEEYLSHKRVVKLQTVVVLQKVVKPQKSDRFSHKKVVKPQRSSSATKRCLIQKRMVKQQTVVKPQKSG
jgi:hypothetical protein